jgi:putative methionine-R-sulfoxide reductase with GAF domain
MPGETPTPSLQDEVEDLLQKEGGTDAALRAVLDRVLGHFSCVTGTVHSLDPNSGVLHLRAYKGLPDTVLARIHVIPIGKGMAGLAAERRQPVQVCNLQTDASGVARPGAKEAAVEGSIAVPMLAGDTLRGVLGVAKPVAYEFSAAEVALLRRVADCLGSFLQPSKQSS